MKRILFILPIVLILIFVLNKMRIGQHIQNPSNAQTLKVLAWEGYADPSIVKKFKEQFGIEVEITYVENDDSLWNLVNQNTQYDLIAANTAEISRYIKAGLLSPLDLQLIPNTKNQDTAFANLDTIKGISQGDKIFAIPYVYSEMGIIYNKKILSIPPHSMKIMWDPKYQGKILAFNTYQHNFTLSALLNKHHNIFNLNDTEIKNIAKDLLKLKNNVLTFYTTIEEATSIFNENNIAILFGNFGQQQVSDLIKNGADIGYVIPNEGALAWLDCWAITSYSRNKENAHRWINFLLLEENSKWLKLNHSLHHTLEDLSEFTSGKKIIWLEPVSNPILRKQLWDSILDNKPLDNQ